MPEKVTEFLSVFDASKQLIRKMPGCTHLELLNDINSPSIFFTYSYWNSENDLNKYRDSDLFKTVWSQTKILFDAKPEAWSVEQKVKL